MSRAVPVCQGVVASTSSVQKVPGANCALDED